MEFSSVSLSSSRERRRLEYRCCGAIRGAAPVPSPAKLVPSSTDRVGAVTGSL